MATVRAVVTEVSLGRVCRLRPGGYRRIAKQPAHLTSRKKPVSALVSIEPLLAVPSDHGRFRWDVRQGTTCWSESVYRLHGYSPHEVVPSAALALGHKHPEDLLACTDALHAAMLADRLVVHEHRLVDAAGDVRQVLMIARPVLDGRGAVQQVCGFLLAVEGGQGELGPHPAPGVDALERVPATFDVSPAAARVLHAAQRPIAAWRTPTPWRWSAATAGTDADRRRDLEDVMFPLEHLTLGTVRPAS